MSATLTDEIHTLKSAMCRDPAILKLEEAEREADTLTQYYVECAEDDKFLLIYVILKLKLLKGKCIVFVNDIDRCYRVKLYLEQFGIRSCVLNAELPLNSRFVPTPARADHRLHIMEEFNKGVYDIILATDEANKLTQAASDDEAETADQEPSTPVEPAAKEAPPSKKRKRKDGEFGVARGIDFQNVSFVLNFDFPTTSKAYLHRIGRTARAGSQGTSLSFIIPPNEYGKSKHSSLPSTKNDTKVLARIRTRLADAGRKEISQYQFDSKQLEAFRYRMTDALRAVTRSAVHQARAQELRKEILTSEKLKRHFEDNPGELDGLRHDEDTHVVRKQAHLKYVPEYLLPGGGKKGGKDLGFVGYRKEEGNRIRKARLQASRKKKFGKGVKPKKRDPLKSFRPGK
jgi:ATP-dependent RNA helicase DDX56/DBP9